MPFLIPQRRLKAILRQSKAMRLWNIIYPIAMYYVVTTLTLFMLDFILPETMDSKLLRQLITSVVAFPVLYSFYAPDQILRGKGVIRKDKVVWRFQLTPAKVKQCVLIGIIGGCFALAFNNILGMIQIAEYSAAYKQVEETFYMGRITLEILALCVVIPIVEELLYRGIVYGRLRDWLGIKAAVLVSAVIFGLVHMNLVQFVYATVFGLLLAWFVEVTEDILGAVIAHMVANLTSVLRAETGVLAFMDENVWVQVVVTVGLLVVCGVAVAWLRCLSRKNA